MGLTEDNLYTTVDGSIGSHFSQTVIDTQKGFCCNDKDKRKLIRWIGCKPSVFRSSKTIFSSDDLSFCNWFQEVSSFNFLELLIDPTEVDSININAKYILIKASWPSTALESQKLIEIGYTAQSGYVGNTIPFSIESGSTYTYFILKDLFNLNSNSNITDIKINNMSVYPVTVSILYAN